MVVKRDGKRGFLRWRQLSRRMHGGREVKRKKEAVKTLRHWVFPARRFDDKTSTVRLLLKKQQKHTTVNERKTRYGGGNNGGFYDRF